MVIPNGYILLAKKTLTSETYRMAPFYREIWIHLLMSVRFSDQTRTIGRNKKLIMAGQIYTTYDKISEDLHWFENRKKCQYSHRQVKKALEFFRAEGMITTDKQPRGVIITICKYKEYQNHENYKKNLGHQNGQESTVIPDSYKIKNKNLGQHTLDLGQQKFLQGIE